MAEIDNTPITDADRADALARYVRQLETERDAMRAEYEATFGELHEQISQWREAMRQINSVARQDLSITENLTSRFILEKSEELLTRYPIRLDGD